VTICIICKKEISKASICDSVCLDCAGYMVDNLMSLDDIGKCAKLGMVALIDEATGYQDIRAREELMKIYQGYIRGI